MNHISVKYCGQPRGTNQNGQFTGQAGVRCCSNDDCGTCKSVCPPAKVSRSDAEQKCSELEMRLCTKKELASEICCGTGCSLDTKLVWYGTEGNVFHSII